MKKKILGLALIAMSLVAFNSMAQTNTTDNTTGTKQENVRGKKGNREKANAFEGLTLSDAQKAQLQQLDSKRKADRQQQAQARKDKKQAMKSEFRTQRKAAKKEYLEEVKAIVGPDNYVLFLENMYVNGGGQRQGKAAVSQKKGDKHQANRHEKGSRKDNRRNDGANRAVKTTKTANTNS